MDGKTTCYIVHLHAQDGDIKLSVFIASEPAVDVYMKSGGWGRGQI